MTDIVNAVFLRGGKVLLAKRSTQRRAYPNRWSFPGGHVEAGESLRDALVRELREEIGVTPVSFDKVGVIRDPDPAAHGDATYHIFAVTAWDGGEPRVLGDEHSEVRWFGLQVARSLRDLAIAEYQVIFERCAASYDRSKGERAAKSAG